MNIVLKNILIYLLLLVLQVIIFNNFTLWGVATPFPFLVFLLMLPVNIRFHWLILIAFFAGLFVDVFSDNQATGIHAFSCVLMISIRNWWIKIITTRAAYRSSEEFSLEGQPMSWYLNFLVPLILVHHITWFSIEAFSFDHFFTTLLKILSSTIYTFTFCLIFTTLFYRRASRR